MKETMNVNIGTQAFTIDDDAYTVLKGYLEEIRCRLPEYDAETINDIELRFAEIFREKVTTSMRVITLDMTRAAMQQMGSPADFGERRSSYTDPQQQQQQQATPAPRKLYRSRSSSSIAGICGGIAEYFDADPTLLRLLTIVMVIFGGLSLWVYIILWIVIPLEPIREFNPKFNSHKTK